MDIKEYISSGILELYVYGALTEAESREVSQVLKKHPEVRQEVEEIELALQKLSAATAPSYNAEAILSRIKSKLGTKGDRSVIALEPEKETNWVSYIGWAATIALLIGLFFVFEDKNDLREQLSYERAKNARMEQQIADAREDAEKTEELLAILRDKNVARVPLQGQNAAPEAYAAVYWNKEENTAYIDAEALPEPPRGKVYQVWSLKLDPLTPTSIGLLDEFSMDDNKIFALQNANESQAFGITLEPEGGSESPTMDQLYVLGAVTAP
ncbi:anti-sigma factor [Christiangramia sabulilitoris]|uniref:Regulator of SigK n=1 Tax=Christiangramia sabulilitoris TaxID=2583991 RepID=A0A550I6V8_9FLAO|nr:anti-sigma factor [Christiangramia sabulilitoris]TRO66714.1 anti-sigma factor [Christiangramia sabulilitoris]